MQQTLTDTIAWFGEMARESYAERDVQRIALRILQRRLADRFRRAARTQASSALIIEEARPDRMSLSRETLLRLLLRLCADFLSGLSVEERTLMVEGRKSGAPLSAIQRKRRERLRERLRGFIRESTGEEIDALLGR